MPRVFKYARTQLLHTELPLTSAYVFVRALVSDPGGPSLGGLRVYIRTTDENNNVILLPVWRLNNHQSMKWRKARVALIGSAVGGERKPPSNIYQVVIEGIWGDARVGAIALDDISFVDGDCSSKYSCPETRTTLRHVRCVLVCPM